MKNLFRLSMMAVFLMALMLTSCDKDENPEVLDPSSELVETSFILELPDLASKDDNKDPNRIPTCVDLDPSYVVATIDNVAHTLKLVTLGGGMETEVIKLAPGAKSLDGFVVFNDNNTPNDTSDDVPVYASPIIGSFYQVKFGLDGVAKSFNIDKFEKRKITIDVLCYQPYDYEDFGFAWFKYAKYEVKTVCFFGDVCTKFFEEWHADVANNPYFGQSYDDGYDFAAIFEVIIKDAQGNTVSTPDSESNVSWQGVGAPLCVEYPDLIGVDESFTAEIWLALPDGSYSLVHTEAFTDANWSGAAGGDNFGGSDGIFDFVVGNCSYDGNNANIELPAWMPIPATGTMTLSPGDRTYVNIEISGATGNGLSAAIAKGIWNTNGTPLAGWCGDKDSGIRFSSYPVNFLSSLDYNSLPQHYKDDIANLETKLNVLNWIVNNVDLSDLSTASDADNKQLGQAILWMIIHGGEGTLDSTQKHSNAVSTLSNLGINASDLSTAADAIKNFKPTVGDWAVVFLDVINDASQPKQMMFIQVDP